MLIRLETQRLQTTKTGLSHIWCCSLHLIVDVAPKERITPLSIHVCESILFEPNNFVLKVFKPITKPLHSHFHFDGLVWIVTNNLQVIINNIVNVFLFGIDFECRKVSRLALELFLERVDMIEINVCVANGVDQLARLASRHVGHQVGQEGIRGNIKGDTQSHVGTPLVHVAAHFVALGIHVELTKHVTRRQGHLIQIGRIPRRHDDTAIFRVVNNFANAFSQLIDALTGIIRVHILVLGAEMTPLKAVDGSQIHFFPVG